MRSTNAKCINGGSTPCTAGARLESALEEVRDGFLQDRPHALHHAVTHFADAIERRVSQRIWGQ